MVGTIKDHWKRQNIQNSSCRFEHSGVISMVYKPFFTVTRTGLAWKISRHFATVPLVSRRNDVWETTAEIPYWWRVATQIWLVLLIGRAAKEIRLNQSEALSRSGLWQVTSKDFLQPFLARHFAVKPVVGSWSVGCFLRLVQVLKSISADVSWKIAREKETEKQIAPSRHFHDLHSHRQYISTYQRARNCSVIVKRRCICKYT